MIMQQYTPEQIALANKFLSPDALLYIVMDSIARGYGLSVVGFGDGERSVMLHARGENKAHYLNNPKYLAEYGLTGADLKAIGESLFKAANEADYFCPLIHGVYMPVYDVISLVEPREQYVERLFPYAWFYMQREQELLKTDVCVVCRNADGVAANIKRKYHPKSIQFIEYGSWRDYEKALEQIKQAHANLVLCSVGQSGKYMIVETARAGKVVLDVGSALINKWQQ